MDHKLKIQDFSFFHQLINFLKIFSDHILMSVLRFFRSFKQYGKKIFLTDLVLDENGLRLDDAADLKG